MANIFAKISLTAKIAAYMRQFTDIPFALDVANLVRANKAFAALLRNRAVKPDDLTWYAPIFEARHKSISAMIRRTGGQQIFEIAAGLSPRGLTLTADPHVNYIETDLEEAAAEKTELLAAIARQHRLLPRSNLRVLTVNAVERDQVQAAAQNFVPGQPLVIVHEGLLQYLSSSETEQVARNIHELLEQFGGTWITPDFALKGDEINISEQQRLFRQIIAETTDRTLYHNVFENVEHLREYFRTLGFQVEVFNQLYLAPNLVSMERLHLNPGLLDELRPRLRLWILTLMR